VTHGIRILPKDTGIEMDKNRFFLDTNVIIDTLNDDLTLLAFLKTLPDALIAASAIILNATVLSNDSRLENYQRPGYTARVTR